MFIQSFDNDSYSDEEFSNIVLRAHRTPRNSLPGGLGQDCAVVAIGSVARNALTISSRGRVCASFRRSLYLELDGGWCCLVAGQLGGGPLNIVTTLTDRLDTISRDTRVFVVGQELFIGNQLQLASGNWKVWQAPVVNWSRQTLFRGLKNLDSICSQRNPDRGLSGLVWPRSLGCLVSPEAGMAQPVFDSLRLWLRQALYSGALVSPPKGIVKLLGLGPGLTPSGDDFLVGLCIALSLCGRKDLVSAVSRTIQPLMTRLTGPISRLHILAAIDGEGNESLHTMINTILTGDYTAISSQLNSISLIGHTSGWDALAGSVTVLREFVCVQP